jgi:quercetin dioxygenase-like cupin family protein
MSAPNISVGLVANIFSKQLNFLKTGDIEQGHTHTYDHLTLLAKGRLKVTVDGKETVFVAPHMIYIAKNKTHILEALEDNTVAYCIHALMNKDTGDLLDPSMVPEGVHPTALAVPLVAET